MPVMPTISSRVGRLSKFLTHRDERGLRKVHRVLFLYGNLADGMDFASCYLKTKCWRSASRTEEEMSSKLVSFLVAACFCASTAAASVIFDQPAGPNGERTSLSSGTSRNFDDFTFANGARVADVHWWGQSVSGGNAFTFTFYLDLNGKPDTSNPQLSTTGSLDAQIVDIGLRDPETGAVIPVSYYSSDLSVPFDASPGTHYWLSIYYAAAGASWGWQQANLGGNGAWLLQSPPPPESPTWLERGDRAFQLTGIPEPGTLALLGLGLAGLAAVRRRKQ